METKAGQHALKAIATQKIKMAQVRIVVDKDSTASMTWERGMAVLGIYELNDVQKIALTIALGIEKVTRGLYVMEEFQNFANARPSTNKE